MSGRRRGQWVRACGTAEWFAHLLLGDCFALQGALLLAREHFEQAWQYYEEVSKKQPADTDIYAAYAAVTSRALLAPVLFMLGYPERARRTNHAALTLAEQHPHPYGTATVWYFTAALHLSRQEWRQASEWAHRVIALATDYGFPQWIASGLIAAGGAQVELENVQNGIAQIRKGLALHEATGAQTLRPSAMGHLARAYAKLGRVEEGIALLAEASEIARRQNRVLLEAGLQLLKSRILLHSNGVTAHPQRRAPQRFRAQEWEDDVEAGLHSILTVARHHEAKMLELQATVTLCRLWGYQDKKTAARKLLANITGWFTEGFDTHALQEANALLREFL